GLGPTDTSLLDWYMGEAELVAGQDDMAIKSFEAAVQQTSTGGAGWIRELLSGARDPVTGLAHLDRQIPLVLAAMPADEANRWRERIERYYLLFGHVDRYLQIALAQHSGEGTWSPATYYVW